MTSSRGTSAPAGRARATASKSASRSVSRLATSITRTASASPASSTARSAAVSSAGVTSAPRSTGLRTSTAPGTARAQGGAQVVRRRRDDHALAVGPVGREGAHAAGVGDDAHPEPGRQRLLHEEQRGLGQLGAGAAGDHPRLVEQRVDADADGRGGGRVLPRPRAAAHHGQQRLLLGEPASGAGELERVAERLEVERARRDRLVVHPGREEVVARHVDLVAEGDEGLHAEPDVAGEVEQREAHAPRLGRDGEAAHLGHVVEEGRVEAGAVGQHALRVGADQAEAVRAGQGEQLVATLVAPVAREARRDDDRSARSVGGGVAQHVRDPVGRHRDDDEVDRTVEVGQAADGRQPVDDVGLRVHHVHGAGVRRAADRVEHAVPEAARRSAYADHGDARRVQQRPERPGGGAPLPLVGRLDRLAGGVGAQLDLHLARDRPAGGAEPGRAEDAQHPVVVAEDLRLEAADPVPPTERGEVLEEQAAQAPAAVLVGDQERDLGGAGGEQLGGRQTGDPPTHERHQGRRRGVVGSEEVVDVEPTGLPAGGEEAQPQRVHGHRLVQPEHGVAVVLAQRSDHRDGPVGEQHVRGLRAPVPGSEGRSRLVGHVPKRARAGRDVPPPRGRRRVRGEDARTASTGPSATRSALFCREDREKCPTLCVDAVESCYLL